VRVGEAPWDDYLASNRAFAAEAHALAGAADTFWVHDYHLMFVPGLLREARPDARIGWFCHIPWPNADLFAIVPWRRRLLEGLLGADVLAFHTDIHVRNFLECVERLTQLNVDHARRVVRRGRHTTSVVTSPIGVPVAELKALAESTEVVAHAAQLRESVLGRRIVLGVDRLDYTKGIPERILAYGRLLESAPQMADDTVLVQVMVPSRTDVDAYAALKEEVDRLVGNVNGRFATTGRVAIHYMFRHLARATLMAHYRAADVALVTPLRDGMNLVAQEYVAARSDGGGVLVLSEFAGAAEYLCGAVKVNPYDVGGIAEALHTALAMPPDQARERMQAMQLEVERLDVHTWAHNNLALLEHRHLPHMTAV
jgi:trehalose-6-phosphate synthase